MREVGLVVVGGGPAGMAAAVEARRNGIEDVLIIERDDSLGGILNQCIHNGFGLHIFGEELTGPEYAWRFVEQVRKLGIETKLDTMVLGIAPDKTVTAVNSRDGILKLKAEAVILGMGCRERTRGALNIPGTRPAGIYTAGTAQRFVNIEGFLPGKKAVILGSGDIGLIMARRMSLEGAEVKMVCELLPYSCGLTRNIIQCLDDFGIPLRLSHTVVKIHGRDRLEGVTVARVGTDMAPIMDTAEYVECDTLLLSVGLIPENELSKEAGIMLDPVTRGPAVDETMAVSIEGMFACGNVVHVHDLVDNVTNESTLAGRNAARYIHERKAAGKSAVCSHVGITAGRGIRYTVPQMITASGHDSIGLLFRTDNLYRNVKIVVKSGPDTLFETRRAIMTPGETERLELKGKLLERIRKCEGISIGLEY